MFGANSVDAIHVPFAATVMSVADKMSVAFPAVETARFGRWRNRRGGSRVRGR